MPKYSVCVGSTRLYTCDIEIEADTPEEAEELAVDIACGDITHPDMPKYWEPEFEYTDGMGVEAISCEEVSDE